MTDRPNDFEIQHAPQQLLDEIAEVEGLGDDDRALLLRLANMVVAEHDRWLHSSFRFRRERDRARERVILMGHLPQCSRHNRSECDCGYFEALHDEPERDPAKTCSDINSVILLDAASFEKVERLLEESPEPNEALKKLMATKPPWKEPK